MVEKVELVAAVLLAFLLLGTPVAIYAYQEAFTAQLREAIKQGGAMEYVVDRDNWNVSKIEVYKGQVVRLVTYGSHNNGLTIEEYKPKMNIYGAYTIDFLADKAGTFKIEEAILERECHCWLTTPYEEVGILIVKEEQ
ncbi:MAG: hypothetical protein HYU39_00420 [Thaumarchaeota archaeon]|nr:hypothetical protein [Nitrososphaerota archaeon]